MSGSQAIQQLAPRRPQRDRPADALQREREVARLRRRESRPEEQLVAVRRQGARARVRVAGLVVPALPRQVVAEGRRARTRRAGRAAGPARRAARRRRRRAGPRASARPRRPRGRRAAPPTGARARRRRAPPRRAARRAGAARAVPPPRRTRAPSPARPSGEAIMFACALKPSPRSSPAYAMQRSPVWTADAAARVDDRRPAGRRACGSAASSAVERVARRLAPREPVEQRAGRRRARRSTASRPRRPRRAPTARSGRRRTSATGRRRRAPRSAGRGRRSSRCRGAWRANLPGAVRRPPDLTTDRARAVLARVRAIPPRARRGLLRRGPRRAALRRHRAVGLRRTARLPWHRVVRADGSLTQGERQAALLDGRGRRR